MAMQDTRAGLGEGQQKPLYGGARNETQYRSGRQLSALRNLGDGYAPAKRVLETANQNLINAGYGLSDALQQRLDWTLMQQRAEQAKVIAASAQAELDQRLKAPDGESGSFFNADHTFNQAELQAFTKSYSDQISGWDKGFISPDYQKTASESMTDMRAGLHSQIAAAIGKATYSRANALLMRGFEERLSLGDFDGAMAYAVEGLKNGGAHDAELPKLRAKAGRARLLHKAKTGASNPHSPCVVKGPLLLEDD